MAALSARFRPNVSLPGLLATVRGAFDRVSDKRRQASVQLFFDLAGVFLEMNGYELTAPDADTVLIIE